MTPETALQLVIRPTLAFMGEKYAAPAAQQELLAIGLQESGFKHRLQVRGPARGYWQFESIGVRGVLEHPASKHLALHICQELDHPPIMDLIYMALADDAILACSFARLLLYTDPKPLPLQRQAGWDYYLRLWRPGKPKPATWAANWARAELTLN